MGRAVLAGQELEAPGIRRKGQLLQITSPTRRKREQWAGGGEGWPLYQGPEQMAFLLAFQFPPSS